MNENLGELLVGCKRCFGVQNTQGCYFKCWQPNCSLFPTLAGRADSQSSRLLLQWKQTKNPAGSPETRKSREMLVGGLETVRVAPTFASIWLQCNVLVSGQKQAERNVHNVQAFTITAMPPQSSPLMHKLGLMNTAKAVAEILLVSDRPVKKHFPLQVRLGQNKLRSTWDDPQ